MDSHLHRSVNGEFISVKILKHGVRKKDPFRTKRNRSMANKDISWCPTRQGSREGNLHQPVLACGYQTVFFRIFSPMVSGAYIMEKPGIWD